MTKIFLCFARCIEVVFFYIVGDCRMHEAFDTLAAGTTLADKRTAHSSIFYFYQLRRRRGIGCNIGNFSAMEHREVESLPNFTTLFPHTMDFGFSTRTTLYDVGAHNEPKIGIGKPRA